MTVWFDRWLHNTGMLVLSIDGHRWLMKNRNPNKKWKTWKKKQTYQTIISWVILGRKWFWKCLVVIINYSGYSVLEYRRRVRTSCSFQNIKHIKKPTRQCIMITENTGFWCSTEISIWGTFAEPSQKIHVSKVLKLKNEKYMIPAFQNIKNYPKTPLEQKVTWIWRKLKNDHFFRRNRIKSWKSWET